MLHINPKMVPGLNELEADLEERGTAPSPKDGSARSKASG
jgi:hypothetical protein